MFRDVCERSNEGPVSQGFDGESISVAASFWWGDCAVLQRTIDVVALARGGFTPRPTSYTLATRPHSLCSKVADAIILTANDRLDAICAHHYKMAEVSVSAMNQVAAQDLASVVLPASLHGAGDQRTALSLHDVVRFASSVYPCAYHVWLRPLSVLFRCCRPVPIRATRCSQ